MKASAALQRKFFRGKQAAGQIIDAVGRGDFRQATEYVGRVCVLAVGAAFPKVLKKCEHPNGVEAQGFDQQFGVETSAPMRLAEMELDGTAKTVQASYYQPSSPELLRGIMRELQALNIDFERFNFVDVGSGKGLVLLIASERPFKRVIGIEFAANLHRAAESNLEKFKSPLKRCPTLESVCAYATKYEFPAEPTVFYLFNPFGEEILGGFLDNVERGWKVHRQAMYLVYVEPLFSDAIERRGIFTKMKEVEGRVSQSYKIYKTVG